jgi:hypothetical protein
MACKKMRRVGILAAMAMAAGASATAAEEGKWVVGVTGGTLGIGPELGYRFGEHGGVRADAAFFSYDHDETIDDIDYDTSLKLSSFGLMADWYPFGGSFRLSAGARSDGNKIDLLAAPSAAQTVQIGDVVYSGAQIGTLTGKADFKSLVPALTLGWGGKFAEGFTAGFEVGVLFQGKPRLDLLASGPIANDPTFQQELAQEIAQAEDDAKDFKLWPVIQLHLSWRF